MLVDHDKNISDHHFFLSSKKTMLCSNRQRNTPAQYPQHVEMTDSSAYT